MRKELGEFDELPEFKNATGAIADSEKRSSSNFQLLHDSSTRRRRIRGRPFRRSPRSMLSTAGGRPRKRGALHKRDVGEAGRTTTRT
jgi:hypothetical protein